jgi:hypothetical protein
VHQTKNIPHIKGNNYWKEEIALKNVRNYLPIICGTRD